jgi:Na+(H+)/acetate symporter ActP
MRYFTAPISADLFGMPIGFAAIIKVSLLTKANGANDHSAAGGAGRA